MAQYFDGSSSVHQVAAPVAAAPMTLACWARPTVTGTGQGLISVGTKDATTHHRRLGFSAGDVVEATARTASNASALSTTGFTVGTWCHACAVFTSSTSRDAYINGGSKGSDTTAKNPSTPDSIIIGQRWTGVGTFGAGLTGDIAEAGVWSVPLVQVEITMLAQGWCPLLVRPDKLVFHDHFIRSRTELKKNLAYTVNGSVVASAHPPLIKLPTDAEVMGDYAAAASSYRRNSGLWIGSRVGV